VKRAFSICLLVSAALLHAQEAPTPKTHSCLVVTRYGTDGPFFYRDQYEVPIDRLQLAYNADELSSVMRSGIKVVVYDTKEHESFAEARESCFAAMQATQASKWMVVDPFSVSLSAAPPRGRAGQSPSPVLWWMRGGVAVLPFLPSTPKHV
jgi:hypothetical protein